ncbi:MAG: IS1096 element passenger TnpR family protein [Candidatus Saccharimonadales bacterium]
MFDPSIPKDYRHDEREERVSDWLAAEYPYLWYTYFGDSWEHEITLEKMVDVNYTCQIFSRKTTRSRRGQQVIQPT